MVSEQAIRLNQPVNTGLTPEPSRIALAEGTLNYSDYVLAREAATGSTGAVID